ncbi:tetratricopeptide repeat protein [Mucilaginibacter sp. P19]|uniref:tetratricopeptide repeat protein n=1 Tax=Mucilaginibacter sp. P19 TaxID=3423947 RepID=UPI003D665184
MGDCYHELKNIKSSDESYEKALTYNPDNAFTLNNYAYYLSLRNEQLEKAAAMSAHSNELQPNTASFEDTYAWILFKQKNMPRQKNGWRRPSRMIKTIAGLSMNIMVIYCFSSGILMLP